ncbi:hypothetical protein [Neobacillus niacini]|uniref:DUF7713 domain-containing protein n=1 Tax=Neobacillus niacini TaxID=86668 RepID=UPI0021CB55E7|nr:hypothetical protein [Neobacillus niacini]MCM3763916.1 hypothetical protein [Neobacillus niacini]
MDLCERCELSEAKIRLHMESDSMHLCNDCYNELMAEDLDVTLQPLLETFSIKDYQGISRTFLVERRPDPMGIFLEASETIEFGYKFAVHGELDCDQQALLNKLIDKAQIGIGKQQVKSGVFPNGQPYHTIMNDQFTGLIEYDETAEGLPLVIIDGKPFSWEEVGRMLMTYEGFQMKLEVYDFTDDVPEGSGPPNKNKTVM